MLSNQLPTDYQQFIHKSRYAKWIPEAGRRENWDETVARYMNYFQGRLAAKNDYVLSEQERSEVEQAVLNLEVMPSMRAMMTAGKALERDGVAGYNCSYTDLTKVTDFDEIMYILLCGTGVGFSCERQFINQLPIVGDPLDRGLYADSKFTNVPISELSFIDKDDNVIYVADSKYGWASALRILIVELYNGNTTIDWDVSAVRPAGSPLKTFGGRASGPEPLVSLLKFVKEVLTAAQGRRLTSVECHDLVCKTAEVVIVGGVRRSALISLSNLSDERMRHAKDGQWWAVEPQRALANNSVAYTEKPEMGTFMHEWNALYESKSGERGIFNREASERKAVENGRRKGGYEWGTNPCCVSGETMVDTKQGTIRIEDMVDTTFDVWNGEEFVPAAPYEAGEADLYRVTLSDGRYLDCTTNHRWFMADGSFIETCDLVVGSQISTLERPRTVQVEPVLIESVADLNRREMTYCFTEPKTSRGTFNGIVTGNSEIILRPKEFCNLSEIVVRPDDTLEDLKRKARIAAILGTFQATVTDFKYLSAEWKANCEEEALLGVSMTGIMDNPLTYELSGLDKVLSEVREEAVKANKEWAEKLGIAQAAAVTAVKPSGTVSQLVNSASGIHTRHNPHYIRTVRGDKKDPITQFMIDQGIPNEDCVMKPESTTVFSFPMASPDNAVCRTDMTAIEQLKLWLAYQRHWCEHKPSVTISVKEHEWMEVGAWVYKHFDEISGVSFLPFSEHTYQQAPYQDCTAEEYESAVANLPESLDWSKLGEYEQMDMTTGSQELACTAGGCEI